MNRFNLDMLTDREAQNYTDNPLHKVLLRIRNEMEKEENGRQEENTTNDRRFE